MPTRHFRRQSPTAPVPRAGRGLWALAVAMLLVWAASALAERGVLRLPHVLVLMSYHHGYSWEDRILQGFEEWGGLEADKPVFHVEWMDTKRYPEQAHRERFRQFLEAKYQGKRFDLIVAVDDNALEFAVRDETMFAGVPIVFSGINGDPDEIVGARGLATGVAERFEVARTVQVALALHPGTRRLVFLTAADESGAGMRQTIGRELEKVNVEPGELIVEHWVVRHLGEIQARLPDLLEDTVVFAFGAVPVSEGGRSFGPEELVAFVRGRTHRPVYSDLDATVGKGAVGGFMNSGLETGRLMAHMAQRVLAGQPADGIPVVYEAPVALMFDYAELSRFGVSLGQLPPGSEVINRPRSIFDPEYRRFLITFSSVIAVLVFALMALLVRNRIQASRQAALHYQATHDDLTGLANRSWLNEYLVALRNARVPAAAGDAFLVLVMMDLNRFKLLNDTHGHSFGDEVLLAVARRLGEHMAGKGELVRFSGDSFVMTFRVFGEERIASIRELCARMLLEPFQIGGRFVQVSAAFGVSAMPVKGIEHERLLREADTAMHEAKQARGNQVVMFDRDIHDRAVRQFQLEASLPSAIDQGALEVHLQPIVDYDRGEVAGFEALARWKHAELGWVAPSEFVHAATEAGCIRQLTMCVLRTACRAFAPYVERSRAYLAVNVTVSDLYAEEFADRIAGILVTERVPPDRLVLEVTEDMLLGDVTLVTRALARLRGQGVRVAIDDFGTGYSSMSYLSNFMVNIIKVDQSFVRNILSSESDQKIVSAIVSMARDLELEVVTEGVENHEQAMLLHRLGCVLLQGYAFGRPRPPGDWLGEVGEMAHLARAP